MGVPDAQSFTQVYTFKPFYQEFDQIERYQRHNCVC